MKNLTYFLLNLAAICIVVTPQNFEGNEYTSDIGGVIENTINSTINKLIANLSDTITIPTKSFDFGEGEVISGGFNVSNMKIGGIKDIVAKEIKVHLFTQKIDMKIALPELSVHLKYWADVLLMNLIPLYGYGRMSVIFDELEVIAHGGAAIKDNPKVKDISLLFSIGEATFDLRGLIDNPEYSALISNVLTDNFANFVNKNSKLISDTISPIIETIINSILEPNEGSVRINSVKVFVRT